MSKTSFALRVHAWPRDAPEFWSPKRRSLVLDAETDGVGNERRGRACEKWPVPFCEQVPSG